MFCKSSIFLLAFLALALMVGAVGCNCDDDDDDQSPADDDVTDDDTGSVINNIDEAVVLLLEEVIETAATGDRWMAFLTVASLPAETELGSAEGEAWQTLSEPAYTGYVDDAPAALWAHAVRYASLGENDGAVTVENQVWPLAIDGVDMAVAEGDGDFSVARLFSSTPMNDPAPDLKGGKDSPTADYGDAPDTTQAYPDGQSGEFPTLYDTVAALGEPGGHCLTVGEEMIGDEVSAEVDADDPADPDGVPNLVDGDFDDGVVFRVNLSATTATLQVLVKVTVAATAPDVTRYINVLMDLNRDGQWTEDDDPEWIAVNHEVNVAPGNSEWITLPAFTLPLKGQDEFISNCWSRIALTRAAIDETAYDAVGGWDGGGEFDYGEIEDHFLAFQPWTGPNDPSFPHPANPQNPQVIPPAPVVCDEICLILNYPVPCQYKALIINGGDKAGQRHLDYASEAMESFFSDYIGDANVTFVDRPSKAELEAAITAFANSLRCYDHPFIYLIAHGAPEPYSPFIALHGSAGREKVTPNELAGYLNKVKPCDPPNLWLPECIEPVTNCRLTLLLESCHSERFNSDTGPLQKDGRNIITTSNAEQPSYVSKKTKGGVFSMLWAKALLDLGDDDLAAVFQAAQDALDALAGNQQARPQQAKHIKKENCVCSCDPTVEDPEDDLIDRLTGEPMTSIQAYWDLVEGSFEIGPTTISLSAQAAGDLPLFDEVSFSYYFVLDADAALENNDQESEIWYGGDHVIAVTYSIDLSDYVSQVSEYDLTNGWQPYMAEVFFTIVDDVLTVQINKTDFGVGPGDAFMFSVRTEAMMIETRPWDVMDWLGLFVPPLDYAGCYRSF